MLLIVVARLADTFIDGPLKETLQINGIDLCKDWTAISGSEGARVDGCGPYAKCTTVDRVRAFVSLVQ